MKGILLIFFIIFLLSATLTTILFSILYGLTETSWGDWIANLVIHAQPSNRNALFISGLISSR
jgi:hypothetical protein